jgi:translocator protein
MSSRRLRLAAAAGPLSAAVIGGLATDPDSRWFRHLAKPPWYPPPQAFGIVWTGLYAGLAWAAGEVLDRTEGPRRRRFGRAYAANLVLNTAWTPLFFRAHRPCAAAAESALLTASTVDLVRRAARVSPAAAAVLVPYALWTAFATTLSAAIARRNGDLVRRRGPAPGR